MEHHRKRQVRIITDTDVYSIVSNIPKGKVATYGQIAAMLGNPRAARRIGWAMSRAHGQALPCHRVVRRDGSLAPWYVFGAQQVQRDELESEGIAFLDDGRIDMRRHMWDGKNQS